MVSSRRSWTDEEDASLRRAVQKGLARTLLLPKAAEPNAFRWHEVAKSVPGRTNKACRKRWCNVLDAGNNKGTWNESEDERLADAVGQLGPKWSIVAQRVGTRGPDQCSSHWVQVLNPDIDYSDWKSDEDLAILHGFNEFGRNWVSITRKYLPRRTPLMVKNRYTSFKSTRRPGSQSAASSSTAPSSRRPTRDFEAISEGEGEGHDENDVNEENDDDEEDGDDGDDEMQSVAMSEPLATPSLASHQAHGNNSTIGSARFPRTGVPQIGSAQLPGNYFSGTAGAPPSGHRPSTLSSQDSPLHTWAPAPASTSQPPSIGQQSSLNMSAMSMPGGAQQSNVAMDYNIDPFAMCGDQMMGLDGSTWEASSFQDLFPGLASLQTRASPFPGSSSSQPSMQTGEPLVNLTVNIKWTPNRVESILASILQLSESMTLENRGPSGGRQG